VAQGRRLSAEIDRIASVMALRPAGQSDDASPLRRIGFGQFSSTAVTAVLAAAFLPMAFAHEHEEGNIPEGATVSVDPIVRLHIRGRAGRELMLMGDTTGYDAMGSHLCADAGVWDIIPRGDGSGGE